MNDERKTERRDEKRQAILNEARKILAKKGIEGLSLRKLAGSLKVTPTMLYFYFKNKDELLRGMLDSEYVALAKLQYSSISGKNPVERLFILADTYLHFALEKPERFKMIFVDAIGETLRINPKLAKGDVTQDPFALLVDACKKVLPLTHLKESDLGAMAESIWGLVHGTACLHLSFKKDNWFKFREPFKQIRFGLGAILTGFGVPKEKL